MEGSSDEKMQQQQQQPAPHVVDASEPHTQPPPRKSRLNDERVVLLGSVIGVACWSLAGNASRLALQSGFQHFYFLETYSTFAPNCVGCFVMGLVAALASTPPQDATFPWIYRSILVGFCGSLTTFSSWILDVVQSNTASLSFGELISGLTMPFIFLLWGRDSARFVWFLLTFATKGSGVHVANVVFLAISVVAAVVIPISLEVAVHQGLLDLPFADRRAVVLGPLGALPRYGLSLLLNGMNRVHKFPLGTLTANVLAVLLTGLLDYFYRKTGNVWCVIVENGLCGALSTVSSFVQEIVVFYSQGRRNMAYIYAFASVASCCVVMALCRRLKP
ncbi:CrcB-like protein [Trypanosoma grayi]|uniref:CrcB-like protein n=1 Tax=Trypanosoma grayi TaxID=71804 RepID=UPI0004F3FEBB|nr:CrcB-like protein [Trypanosoma grayi]KEG09593.1 CrcB-like protein [Trypanosoma grayi]